MRMLKLATPPTHVLPLDMEVEKMCDVCGTTMARYCCPSCGKRTCSVFCVRQHKEDTGCTGKRSMSKYVPLSEFTTTTLHSDYYFLEDVSRVIDATSRDTIKRTNYLGWRRTKNMNRLKGVAHNKGINLHFSPPGLTIHKTNTSKVIFNKTNRCQQILWRIHWKFHDCGLEYYDENVNEDLTIDKMLEKYIHSTKSSPLTRHRLQKYVKNSENIIVLMKKERTRMERYYELNVSDTLMNNLKGKIVIEYPVLYVVLRDGNSLKDFPIYTEQQHDEEVTPQVEEEFKYTKETMDVEKITKIEEVNEKGNDDSKIEESFDNGGDKVVSTMYSGLSLIASSYDDS